MARKHGHTEMGMLLLGRGADPHIPCYDMPCALFMAVKESHMGLVQTLLKHHSGADDIHRQDFGRRGILHILASSSAAHVLENIDIMVQSGADVHLKDNSGSTPLHEAARLGNATLIKKLLHHGAVPNAQNYAGRTPLELAQASRHKESVELLGGRLQSKTKRWFSSSKIFNVAV